MRSRVLGIDWASGVSFSPEATDVTFIKLTAIQTKLLEDMEREIMAGMQDPIRVNTYTDPIHPITRVAIDIDHRELMASKSTRDYFEVRVIDELAKKAVEIMSPLVEQMVFEELRRAVKAAVATRVDEFIAELAQEL